MELLLKLQIYCDINFKKLNVEMTVYKNIMNIYI